jgi:tetratricopeptide (TPR) repeat protein
LGILISPISQFNNRAYTHKEFGQLKDSIQSFEICIQKYQQKGYENEELAGVYYEKGLVLEEQTKFQEAQESIKEANQLKHKKEYTNLIKAIDRKIKKNKL